MDEICGTKFTALHLRQWLRLIGLPSTGSKNELLLRINKVPVDVRGECPVMEMESRSETKDECEGAVGYVGDSAFKEVITDDHQQMSGGLQQQMIGDVQQQMSVQIQQMNDKEDEKGQEKDNDRDEDECSVVVEETILGRQEKQMSGGLQQQMIGGVQKQMSDNEKDEQKIECFNKISESENNDDKGCFEIDLLLRELDLVKREKELLRRENDLLKRITESKINNKESEKTVEENKQNLNLCMKKYEKAEVSKIEISFAILKDMIADYDVEQSAEMWIAQFGTINSVYNMSEDIKKALLMCKLKGKAQNWLHLNPYLMCENSNEIIVQMKSMFGTKPNKLIARRKFEARAWQSNEHFEEYFNEKVMLSNCIGIDDDELIDCIIEGIPDRQLKNQARLQCFTNKSQLLLAFSRIDLTRYKNYNNGIGTKTQESSASEKSKPYRCYNCNSIGHVASECQKPKREMGACFGCGNLSHRVAECPERKIPKRSAESENYNA